jgi:hypothetical protein
LTYANVMASVAVFLAIGGTTIAATKIDGSDIERGSIKGKSLAKATIAGKKLKADTINGTRVLEPSLGEVPSAATADEAQSAQSLGGKTAADLTDDCPSGTALHAGACIETAIRPGATFSVAARTCADAGRRLPSFGELEAWRQEPGFSIGSPEFTDTVIDGDGNPIDSDGFVVVGLRDNGTISTGLSYNDSSAQFRCVAPLTNR